MKAPDDLMCSACGYQLRGLDAESRCPECGQTVRRTLAAARLAVWHRLRWESPAVIEGFAALPICALGIYILLGSDAPFSLKYYIISGVIVGFSFTLSFSSVRRARGRARDMMMALSLGPMAVTALWLLAVLMGVYESFQIMLGYK